MAIRPGLCDGAKLGFLTGVHTPRDDYRIALYGAGAALDTGVRTYSPDSEVSGQGYLAGGISLMGYEAGITDSVAWVNWTVNPTWPNCTVRARGALIYNASKGNAAIEVLEFGKDFGATNGLLELEVPASGPTALVTFK